MAREYKTEHTQSEQVKLDPNTELRIHMQSYNGKCYITLKSGSAELFGAELVIDSQYELEFSANVAVFTRLGCVIEIKGSFVYQIGKKTPMNMYLKCHNKLNEKRISAKENNNKGPVAMVIGPCDVGKSTVVKILLNYAARSGHTPIYVNLDVGVGEISLPGTIGALLIQKPSLIEEGFLKDNLIDFHFGNKSPSNNSALLKMLMSHLARNIADILKTNQKTNVSGIIINTCGWVNGEGYKNILHAMTTFKVDNILVIDDLKLYNRILNDASDAVVVDYINKSCGVVRKLPELFAESRRRRMHEYFFGTKKNPLRPHTFNLNFIDIKLFKTKATGLQCLPNWHNAAGLSTKLVLLTPNLLMLYHLLAVSSTKTENKMIASPCDGFICITDINERRQTMTVLSRQPSPLPNNLLMLSDLQFMH